VIERVTVSRGSYHDSARLMHIARELGAVDGIASAEVMMGTTANVALLAGAGFPRTDLETATPMDLVVAFRGTAAACDAAARRLLALLAGDAPGTGTPGRQQRPATVAEAVRLSPGVNLVSIAVPGPYAAFVAGRALDAGRHVFLFSDNVPVADEVALKTRAGESGLLLMGPDCGTAIIAGAGLGFANRVPRGPVGIVGASGTGTQEVCCLLSHYGVGISHAIGTGSRDLTAAVDGRMTAFALQLLADDPSTRAIVLIAKHPAPEVARRLHSVLEHCGKPVVVRYLGEAPRPGALSVTYADSLDEAAELAAAAVNHARPGGGPRPAARTETAGGGTRSVSGRLVGLFGGGSLAAEAQYVLSRHGIRTVEPDRALVPGQPIPGEGHLVVDTGDDTYTVGRPHPMVDQAVRCGLIRTAGIDPSVGLILIDLVLGDGSHADPAPEIAAAVREARDARADGPLAVVCSVCGSVDDPQGTERQVAVLRAADITVTRTAADAARTAARLLGHAGEGDGR